MVHLRSGKKLDRQSMSAKGKSEPSAPGSIVTPQVEEPRRVPSTEPRKELFPQAHEEEEEEEQFEDASEDGEVFVRAPVRTVHAADTGTQRHPQMAVHHQVSPHIRPESYDGTTDWSEYLIYFEQLAELYGWDDERKAMILGLCLKDEARVVLASLSLAERHSYFAVTTALTQSFAPKERVHLYQAELKARRKKTEESMTDLGRDIAKLVRLAYPTADAATKEVVGINIFLDALPGPAADMKLHVIKGRPRTLQEAVAHATEVDAVIQAEGRKLPRRDVRMVGEPVGTSSLEIQLKEVQKLQKELQEALSQAQQSLSAPMGRGRGSYSGRRREYTSQNGSSSKSFGEVTCYGCGEKGHIRRYCPKQSRQAEAAPSHQGNGEGQLNTQ